MMTKKYNCASDSLRSGQLDRISAKIKDCCPINNEVKTMKFTKEFLQELANGNNEYSEVIKDDIVDTSRWAVHYIMVFKLDGKFYETFYSRGATEYQDEDPYEYDDDVIECDEVFPKEKTIIVYER